MQITITVIRLPSTAISPHFLILRIATSSSDASFSCSTSADEEEVFCEEEEVEIMDVPVALLCRGKGLLSVEVLGVGPMTR
jgi:hypothetical protein